MVLWVLVPNDWTLFAVAFVTYAAFNFSQGPYYTRVMEVARGTQFILNHNPHSG